MPSTFVRRGKRAKRRYFPLETIVDELFQNILEHIKSKEDLYHLCLVSRRMYIVTIEHLFRDLSLDLAAASHRRLLERLTHGKSALMKRIRVLHLSADRVPYDDYAWELRRLVSRMKHLKKIVFNAPLGGGCWNGGYINLLDAIYIRFPDAIIEVTKVGATSDVIGTTIIGLAMRSAHLMLTRLEIDYIGSEYVYFKHDLIIVLQRATALESLHVRSAANVYFTKSHAEFPADRLPKLKVLDLGKTHTTVFTPGELMIWADNGGWSRLTDLTAGSLDYFRCFVGRDVGLRHLTLHTDHDDFEEIDKILRSANVPVPFSDLRSFRCLEKKVVRLPGLQSMPASNILRWMPKLQSLVLARGHNSWNPLVEPHLPSPQQVSIIQHLCPDLEFLSIEMGLARKADKPLDLIKELCRFEKPIVLDLFVCLDTVSRPKARGLTYWHIAREMYRERKRLGLAWQPPFEVKFTTVRHGHAMPIGKRSHPSTSFENFDTGSGALTLPGWGLDESDYSSSRSKLDRMTVEKLEKNLFSTVLGVPVCKRGDLAKEIERRKRDEHASWGPDEYPTLYDKMVKGND